MRDGLRAVNCPADMIDQIGGWRNRSVGEGYGKKYSISAICNWLLEPNLNIINSECLDSDNPL